MEKYNYFGNQRAGSKKPDGMRVVKEKGFNAFFSGLVNTIAATLPIWFILLAFLFLG